MTPTSTPGLDARCGDLSAADLAQRVLVASAATRRAEALAGAALERLADGPPKNSTEVERRDWSLAHACPPTLTGFAEVHAGLSPRDAAAARGLSRALGAVPQLDEAAREGVLRPTGLRLLARLSNSTRPEKVREWLLVGRRMVNAPAGYHRLLAAAEDGEGPRDVDRDVAAVRDGPIPSGWRISETAALDAPSHSNWCRTRSLLTGRAADVLSPDEVVEKIAERLAQEPDPESLAAIRRPLEYHVDPIRQVAWLQTGAGRLRVPMSSVPPPGPNVRFHVMRSNGEPVPFTAEELLAAFPDLRNLPGPDPVPDHVPKPAAPPSLAASPPRPEPAEGRPRVAVSNFPDKLPDSGPLPARWPPRVLRLLASASGRCVHALRWIQVGAIAELDDRTRRGSPYASAALEDLRHRGELSDRDLEETARVGRRLRALPCLREAFAAGRASYTKVRAAVRKAVPFTDARWAELCRRLDTAGVEAFAAATPYGQIPPLVPEGWDPLLPEGFLVRERIRVTLRGSKGESFARLRAALNRVAGRALSSGEALGLVAGWFLQLEAPRVRDVVIYQRSPESRVPGQAAVLMAPALRAIPDVGDRLEAAFPHLRKILRDLGRARRSLERIRRAEERARERKESAPTKAERDLVRWRDGDVCIVPGCRNSLVVQYDHGNPVSLGGRADVRWDHRLCGPCNRAKHLGEIEVLAPALSERSESNGLPDGTVRVTDRDGVPLGSGEPIGLDLDRPLLETLWTAAAREVAARVGGTLSSASGAPAREPEPALAAVF
ncbi:MAG: hypothetical protein L0216_16080 [Planctomycetales bacterium]|nr:hypothetical protein [Planctomycetales bacterium]